MKYSTRILADSNNDKITDILNKQYDVWAWQDAVLLTRFKGLKLIEEYTIYNGDTVYLDSDGYVSKIEKK